MQNAPLGLVSEPKVGLLGSSVEGCTTRPGDGLGLAISLLVSRLSPMDISLICFTFEGVGLRGRPVCLWSSTGTL